LSTRRWVVLGCFGALTAMGVPTTGCALLVPDDLGAVSCRDLGAVGEPACPRGNYCAAGECTRCALSETCGDGLDNDCDGQVDDGCAVGEGGEGGDGGSAPDGGSGGGAGAGQTGGTAGKSGASGQGGKGGKGGAGGKGGSQAGAGGSPAGGNGGSAGGGGTDAAGAGGDAGGTSGTAGSAGATPLASDGEECEADADCLTGSVCASLFELGASSAVAAPPSQQVCSRACVQSGDCGGTGAVCQPIPSGGAVCLQAIDVGRVLPGAKSVGGTCTTPGDCRSAWCEEGVCVDTCGTNDDCTSAGALNRCVAATGFPGSPDAFARRCGKPVGTKGPADPCMSGTECVEGDCRTLDSKGSTQLLGFTCTIGCCTNDDCAAATFQVGSGGNSTFQRICTYDSGMRACSTGNSEVGSGLLGDPCDGPGDCRSLFCLDNICSDTCCDDSSCIRVNHEGLRCLPTQVDSKWELRCRLP
jgi:hypothetical protein